MLLRHGQTSWSELGRHTSTTDLDLTQAGAAAAVAAAGLLRDRRFEAVLCSPRLRARHTAELAGLPVTAIEPDLAEWFYGDYEGLTTPQIRRERPDWSLWTDGCPGGESPQDVGERLDRVLARARTLLPQGDVALVGHGHALRVAAARWIGLPTAGGALLRLDTATLSTLGHEREQPVILAWNIPA